MLVVVLIPAYNEESTIGSLIQNIPRTCAEKVQVLVLNDGSKDKTEEVAKKSGADRIVSHSSNLGLGTAFKDGINEALAMGADIIVNIDADGQFNPQDIPRLLEPIINGKADMVTCSRFKDPLMRPKMPYLKYIGNKLFSLLISWFLEKKFYDTQCGFRAYSREAALRLTLFGKYTYTQEVFIDLVKKKFRIVEVPCQVVGERKGKSRVVKNVFSYGLKVMLIIIRSMRDYEPLKFFGMPGFFMVLLGTLSSLILFIRWLLMERVDPYLIVVYGNIFLIIIGVLFIILGLITDMLDRNRQIQEEIMYHIKKNALKKRNG